MGKRLVRDSRSGVSAARRQSVILRTLRLCGFWILIACGWDAVDQRLRERAMRAMLRSYFLRCCGVQVASQAVLQGSQ